MKTVKEVSRLTGVSVRTLHHYDAIGLLKPTKVTDAGYRLYGEDALRRLQTVLLFRELQFPLHEIKEILDTPGFDPVSALAQQIQLLELQRDHLSQLISYARQIQQTGVMNMNFKPFDKSKMDEYAAQAKAQWGSTDAYREYTKKSAGRSKAQENALGGQVMDFFVRLGALRHLDPGSAEVQAWVRELQAFFTQHYYNCTPQILRSLAESYAGGGSMNENIDAAGGEGTGAFAREAIMIYCGE